MISSGDTAPRRSASALPHAREAPEIIALGVAWLDRHCDGDPSEPSSYARRRSDRRATGDAAAISARSTTSRTCTRHVGTTGARAHEEALALRRTLDNPMLVTNSTSTTSASPSWENDGSIVPGSLSRRRSRSPAISATSSHTAAADFMLAELDLRAGSRGRRAQDPAVSRTLRRARKQSSRAECLVVLSGISTARGATRTPPGFWALRAGYEATLRRTDSSCRCSNATARSSPNASSDERLNTLQAEGARLGAAAAAPCVESRPRLGLGCPARSAKEETCLSHSLRGPGEPSMGNRITCYEGISAFRDESNAESLTKQCRELRKRQSKVSSSSPATSRTSRSRASRYASAVPERQGLPGRDAHDRAGRARRASRSRPQSARASARASFIALNPPSSATVTSATTPASPRSARSRLRNRIPRSSVAHPARPTGPKATV